MYYPSSENKGADQLRGYREADLRLCFRLGKNPVFSRCGSIISTRIRHAMKVKTIRKLTKVSLNIIVAIIVVLKSLYTFLFKCSRSVGVKIFFFYFQWQ